MSISKSGEIFLDRRERWARLARKKIERDKVVDKEKNTTEFFYHFKEFIEVNTTTGKLNELRERMREALARHQVPAFADALRLFVVEAAGENALEVLDLSVERLSQLDLQVLFDELTMAGDEEPDTEPFDDVSST